MTLLRVDFRIEGAAELEVTSLIRHRLKRPMGWGALDGKKMLWVSIGALAAAAAVSLIIVFAGGSSPRPTVAVRLAPSGGLASVPAVLGLKRAAAASKIVAAGLRVNVQHLRDPTRQRGVVFRIFHHEQVKGQAHLTILVSGAGSFKINQ